MVDPNPIKLFEFLQKYCQTVGIRLPQSDHIHHRLSAINLIFLISLTIHWIATIAFTLYDANHMSDYGIGIVILSSDSVVIAVYLITIWKLKDILKFIQICERFIGKRHSKAIEYKKAIKKIDKICKWYSLTEFTSSTSTAIFTLIYTGVKYFILDLGIEAFSLYPPAKWPFDWKTPIGYLAAWFFEYAGVCAIMLGFVPFYGYLIGSCCFFYFIIDDIRKDLMAFNTKYTTETAASKPGHDAELKNQFRAIIQIYGDARECVAEFKKIYKYSLFAFFLWIMVLLISSLVTVQFAMWADDWNLIEILDSGLFLLWSLAFNSLVCELGQWVTGQCENFNNSLGMCAWYTLTVNMQRVYLIFLLDTQQAVYIQSFGGIVCSRDTFKKITNSAFSYFMILRRMR